MARVMRRCSDCRRLFQVTTIGTRSVVVCCDRCAGFSSSHSHMLEMKYGTPAERAARVSDAYSKRKGRS